MTYYKNNEALEVKEFISVLLSKIKFVMEEQLVGIYLHGSLAMGGFNPAKSDIDLIIVTEFPLSIPTKRKLAQLFLTYSKRPFPVEISFLNLFQLQHWKFPTPFDFHYSEFWRKRYEEELMKGTSSYLSDKERKDSDLAAHLMILNHRGICLWGKSIPEVIPSIPKSDYLSSILVDYKECLENFLSKPIYCVLNLLRIYWYLLEGKISSKLEAGHWGAATLPKDFRPLVNQLTNSYENEKTNDDTNEKDLTRIKDYLESVIEELLTYKLHLLS